MLYITPFLLSMVVTMATMPVLARLAARFRFVDEPGMRKVHAAPIPRIGGVAIGIGVLAAALIVLPLERPDLYFLGAAGLVALFGALDDRLDLDYRIKFGAQLLAAALVVVGGGVQIRAFTFEDSILLPEWASIPLTLLFLVGITNAINLADGLDGLAGGTMLLSLCALAMLAHGTGQFSTAALALTFAGAVLGFLRFNTFPASIFMGDAGSQLIGFAVAVLSIRATQSATSSLSAATPVLLLALPILDTLSVMVQRVSEGRSPFSPDKNHIHHKLLSLGFDHHEAVMVIYAIQADLLLLAYCLRYESDLVILAVVTGFFICAIVMLQLATRRRWRFRAPKESRDAGLLARAVERVTGPASLPRWSYHAVAVSLGVYATLVMLETVSVTSDVKLLLVAMLAVTATWFALSRSRPLSLVEKATLYVTATVLVYLDTVIVHGPVAFSILNWSAVLTAAAGTILRVRLSNDRRFEITPLDLIVVFAALVLPSLASSVGLPQGGAVSIAKLVVLFYSVEVLVNRAEIPVMWLRLGMTAVLAGLIFRPLL
jgi:UDP-GlcNAc:undecaprenyl-phosphate GlcNAc-1-phosphate transferase